MQPDDHAPAERERTIRHNMLFWALGRLPTHVSLAFREPAVVQGLLVRLEASNLVLGLVGASRLLAVAGFLAGGFITDRVANRGRALLVTASLVIWPYLALWGTLEWRGPALELATLVWPLVVSLVLARSLHGASQVIQSDFLSRVVPRDRRGRIVGLSMALGGAAAIVASLVLAWLLSTLTFPHGYACAFVLTAAGALLGALLTSRCRPLGAASTAGRRHNQAAALANVWRDKRYRAFLALAATRTLGSVAVFFIVPVALRQHSLPAAYVAWFAMTGGAAALFGSPLAGWVADRFGRGQSAAVGGVLGAVGLALVLVAPGGLAVVAAYGLARVGMRSMGLSVYLTAMEISPAESRGTYLSVRYSVEQALHLGLLPVAGWLLDVTDPWPVFVVGGAAMLLAGTLLWRSGLQDGEVEP